MNDAPFGYRLADVFAAKPYQGNGVAVFVDPPVMSTQALQSVTVEVRQFESAFVWSTPDPNVFETRIFVLDQELAFAGHPLLGTAAALHERLSNNRQAATTPAVQVGDAIEWSLRLGQRRVSVTSRPDGNGGFDVSMDQGRPEFGQPMPPAFRARVAAAMNLEVTDIHDNLPLQTVSTGLSYLMIPVHASALAKARILIDDFAALLGEAGALLAYVLDPAGREGRNWVNDGSVEDIATGSASGPAAAYLVQHQWAQSGEVVEVSQGRFVGRPSIMSVEVDGDGCDIRGVVLSGHVCMTGSGSLDHLPSP